jgi:hypothetical protein
MEKKKKHWFHFASSSVFILFLSIMVYVTYVAFSRHSGSTNLDIAKIQKIRYDAENKKGFKK